MAAALIYLGIVLVSGVIVGAARNPSRGILAALIFLAVSLALFTMAGGTATLTGA